MLRFISCSWVAFPLFQDFSTLYLHVSHTALFSPSKSSTPTAVSNISAILSRSIYRRVILCFKKAQKRLLRNRKVFFVERNNSCNYSARLVLTILSSFFCLFKFNLFFCCMIFYVLSKVKHLWLLLSSHKMFNS